jgi:SAM-dependent methyltransferase
MTVGSDRQRGRQLYEQRLRPVLMRCNSSIELDDRNEFYLRLLSEQGLLQPGKHLVDLGAGLSVFGPLCRAYGMDVTLVDDFGGGGGVDLGQPGTAQPVLQVLEGELGLHIVRENFLENPLPLPDASVDVVTCFHSLEHWHHSPKRLFAEIVRIIKPGGFLVIATPNAVNLRKRVYVLLGRTNYPALREWYYEGEPVFRGHVREPTLADLCQLLEWNGFAVVAKYGRNFIGRQSQALSGLPAPLVNALAVGSQAFLQLFPRLCSDLHVVGKKIGEGRRPSR